MSRRLHQRGRYPKTPGIDQINSSNSQYAPAAPVTQPMQSGMTYYDPSAQPQADKNSWNPQLYPNSTNFQQPATSNQSAPEQSNYWSETQIFPSTMQAPWNETWNSKPEPSANNSGLSNYQQPPVPHPTQQQWPQPSYMPVDNQSFSQSHVSNYDSQNQQQYVYQSMNNAVDYPSTNASNCQPNNSIPNYQPAINTSNYQPMSTDFQTPSNSSYQSVNNVSNYQPTNNIGVYQSANSSNYQQGINATDFQSESNAPESLPINKTADYPPSSNTGEYPFQPGNNTADYQSTNSTANFQSVSNTDYQPATNPSAVNTTDYQFANNTSNHPPADDGSVNASLQNWESGTVNVTEPQELPWTYSTPQYCNPPQSDFTLSSNPTPNTAWHPSVSSSQGANFDSNLPNNYLPQDSGNTQLASESVPKCASEQSKQNGNEACNENGASIKSQAENCDIDYDSSTLSAFFHPSEQSSETVDNNLTENVETSSQEIRTYSDPIVHNGTSESSGAVSEIDCSESTHNDFLQEESVDTHDSDAKSSQSPGATEEPINQEVPEPCRSHSLTPSTEANKESDESSEEPFNQQVPKSNQSSPSRSTSMERERIVIRPREDSPFKPPRPNNMKNVVVQQEVTSLNPLDVKPPEEKTVVQEVNLETFPDNLERPSDFEELRKQSPLYASHKHVRQELNSSPSSLLCDNPDIPCVTLAPAAPPISYAKSDKSESSTDSKSDRFSLHSSNLSLYKLQETIPKNFDPVSKSESLDKNPTRNKKSPEREHQTNLTKFANEPTAPMAKEKNMYKSRDREQYNVGGFDHQPPLPLRDSKIDSTAQNSGRYEESFQKTAALDYSNVSSINNSPRREESHRKHDSHYENRQKFAEQKYYSYDERQYYSDKEGSRPSSRNSLRDRQEEYPYHPRHDDYPYHSDRGESRHPQDYHRPPSRMSESELSRTDKYGQYGGYYPQQYPYQGGPPNTRDRNASYYQRPQQKGYDYDPYQRDMYNYASYYDAYQRYAYNNFNYGFYDELYRNDPRYRQYREAQEQYRQYYAKHGYDEYERSSVHSGRSSANELSKDCNSSQYHDNDSNESEMSAYNLQQGYSYNDGPIDVSTAEADVTSTPSSRLTPVKFSYPHPIACFSPGGLLITCTPSNLSTSSVMPIRIHNMQEIREGEESYQELKNHQGPLIRGLTHKNDVIEFCSQKIKTSKNREDIVDRDSYTLLWELMILLLRQNGSVAGSDIAELLLKDHEILRPASVPLKQTLDTPLGEQHSPADVNDSSSQSHAGDTSSPDEGIVVLHDRSILNNARNVDVDKITRKFREFLLFGHKKDALEWAMKHGLWGHALFLASKMDLRTYANVMTRFANSLALNDPLQTLYQLMSGRQPLAVTNVADKKWGDWRPHLAMILSNPSTHPEVDSRSITTLGDTLASKGCLCAAHFCYVMAQVEFGTYEQKNSKLVLLATSHTLPFDEFATNEAIQCTEIYEYAQSLANPNFMLTHLQFYKFLYAMRLVEHGFLEEGLHYCEIIASKLQEHPHLFQYDFINEILKLATSLKYHDPHFLRGQGEYEDQDDPEWLKNLANLVQNFNTISTPAESYSNSFNEQQAEINQNFPTEYQQFQTQPVESTQNIPNTSIQNDANNSYNNNQSSYYQQNNWQQQNSAFPNTSYQTNSIPENSGYYNRNDIVNTQSSFHRENSIPSHEENETTDVPSSPVTQTPPFDYYSGGTQQVQETKPLYEVSNFSSGSLPRERRDSALSSGSRYSSKSMSTVNKTAIKDTKKSEPKKDKASTQAGKTWLGGIFNMLLPKGPNQMILPDDKNPTIVWDDVNNCWVNKDSNEDDENSAPLAPPTDSELMGSKSSETNFHSPVPPMSSIVSSNSVPPTSNSQPPVNKFQRPKTRGMRQNYVDVLSNTGATKKSNALPEGLFTPTFDNSAAPNVFMPQPVATQVPSDNSTNFEQNHSVYNSPQPETKEPQSDNQAPPLMFNPAEFDSRRTSTTNQRHTIGRMSRRTYPT